MCPLESKTTADKGEQFLRKKKRGMETFNTKKQRRQIRNVDGSDKKLRGNETST